jgi:carnitine-CoA ligase
VTTVGGRWDVPAAGGGTAAPDILTLVARACRRAPDAAAIVFEDGVSITRGELLTAVERFAGGLHGSIAPGDRVAIMLENRIEFMVAWLAVVANGAVLVSMNHSAGEHDAAHMLRDSGAVLAIVGERTRPLVESLRAQAPALRTVLEVAGPEPHGLDRFCTAESLPLGEVMAAPATPANVYYTSGTTGQPKGCIVTHAYWLRFVDLWLRLYGMGPDDRLLCCLQFFYGDPPWQLLASLEAGCPWIVMRRFSVSRFWDVVRSNAVTQLFSLASIPSLLMTAPPDGRERDHRVRFGVHLGIPPNLHRAMAERWGFPWVEAYGLTESGFITAMPLCDATAKLGSGSIGLACPEVALRLVDEAGRDVAAGRPGEVVARCPAMMEGYLGRPEATTAAVRGGWLHTGDLARRDDDGFLYFLGRRKEVIRRSGENVAPAEVEALLAGHPAIVEAAVVPVPDDLRGEEVMAHVLLVPGAGPETVPPADLVAFCAHRLAKHKVPRYIAYRDRPFPRTPSMRVKKSELAAEAAAVPAWDRELELGW